MVRRPPDLWLTYHSYYKAPDVIGPAVSRRLRIPYVIFQGIFSTKRRRDIRTRPGFLLNRSALKAAAHVLTNKRVDLKNLKRLLPADRLTYLPPGIFPDDFRFDPAARARLRRRWQVADAPVVLTAAMYQTGCKDRRAQMVDPGLRQAAPAGGVICAGHRRRGA